MKAVLLAAGKGERLKDITSFVPKPMILLQNRPILSYNIELCKNFGVTELFINTHHLSEQITSYFGNGEKFGVKIKYSYEGKLLGTSGALKSFRSDLTEPFYVIYSDQVSNYNLELLKQKFSQVNKSVIGLHYREDTEHSGVVELSEENRILKFVEKPKKGESDSHWVNAGIYLLEPIVFNYIHKTEFSDFGKNIFPDMLKNNEEIYGVCENISVDVFDTPEMYKRNIK